MGEVKTFRVSGMMLIGHDRLPRWQSFTKEVRALSKEEALEKVYSLLGSAHKLKRYHIKIVSISEIDPEEAEDKFIRDLAKAERLVA